ncbi:efflux RND transporter periplasmic adaptor subunit [Thermoflexibacter ruber]|uniref:HlyD family secretion protein n=1 Tax=Thermoflexibacter ruber TaxID=1003 RepID=A0A1I2FIE7_9BACT|nr:efflux RND transporter periplasmic adaptor subunit [Thermoflexibacter ruber]SFF05182.1 HlyD family secretion protein [Thermoflexibacter ruber]
MAENQQTIGLETRKIVKKKKSNKTLYIVGGVLLALIVFAVIARKAGWVGGEKPTEVLLSKVQKAEIVEKVSASGKIQPVTEIKISPQVSGEVIELLIGEGDSVRIGELLAKIKPDFLKSALDRSSANLNSQRAQLEQVKARFEQSKAQYVRAKADYDRQEKLFEQKAISKAEMDLATANLNAAKADLDAATKNIEAARFGVQGAEASVKEASENLSFTSIYAPMGGTISKLNIEKGERVVGTAQMAGTEMMRIADLSRMEVRVDVNENDIVRVSTGDTAIVEVDAYPDKKFKGIVTLIGNSAKQEVGASTDAITEFEVRILMLSESYKELITPARRYPFRPGMTANVEIITERKSGIITVPLAAVTTRTGMDLGKAENESQTTNTNNVESDKPKSKEQPKEVVFVHNNGTVKLVEVKTGISDFDNIEILSGLKEGDEVVSGPFLAISKLLKDGDKVVKMKDKKSEEVKK